MNFKLPSHPNNSGVQPSPCSIPSTTPGCSVLCQEKLCLPHVLPSSLNTTSVTTKCFTSSTNSGFLVVAVGYELQSSYPRGAGGAQDSWRPQTGESCAGALLLLDPWVCSPWKGLQKTGLIPPDWDRAGRDPVFPFPSPCVGSGKPKHSPWHNR